jgi:cholesterol oxidase
MNYLPDAEAHGAEIFCQVEVLSIEPTAPGSAGTSWTVHCSSTDPGKPQDFDISTDLLILAAGTLGTTEILLRSRSEAKCAMSDAVGLHYGTDGDFFAVGYNGEQPFNAVGYGSGAESAKHRTEEGGPSGPCITSVLDMRDPKADVREGMIIEDMAIPSAFAEAVSLAFATFAAVEGQPTQGASAQAALARQTASFQKGPWTKDAASTNSVMWGASEELKCA